MTKKETTGSEVTKPKTNPAVAPPKPGCTLYLGRLPHGFYEEEIRGYFGQFGQVTRVRVSRNRRTGAPKHYGFVEMTHPEVAKIVAETMNNYLLFGHLLQCKVVPEAKLHAEMFEGANRRFTRIPWQKIAAAQYNNSSKKKSGSEEEEDMKKRVDKVKERCKTLGIDYDFDSVVTSRVEQEHQQ